MTWESQTTYPQRDNAGARASSLHAWGNRSPADIVETCRAYLLMAANKAVGSELRVKVAPSDLVQETIFAAVQDFENFNGSSERELLAWLTKILSYRIVDAARRFRRQKADIGREVSIDHEAMEIELSLSGMDGTPSALVMAEDEEKRLLAAMKGLDADDEQLVRMRNWEQLSFVEIGKRLGLSESGTRKRWGQAVQELRRRLDG
jgi:RNA polymerase sigma-70 factor, ECF subfamily